MLTLLIGLGLFIGAHLLPASTGLSATLKIKLGAKRGYPALIAVLSLAGVVAICVGYPPAKASFGMLYTPPSWLAHIALLLMFFAFVLFGSSKLSGKIAQKAKHPMLASAKIWAVAHLLANGAVADVVLFGGLLAWAVAGRISLKRRERAGLAYPNAGGPIRNDIAAVVVACGLYAAFLFWIHAWLFGVAPIYLS